MKERRFERDAVTRMAYAMLALWGFLLYALGPALPALRESLDVSRAAVSLHTTLTATGAIVNWAGGNDAPGFVTNGVPVGGSAAGVRDAGAAAGG